MRVLYLTMNPNRMSTTVPTEGWFRLLADRGLSPVLVSRERGEFDAWARERGWTKSQAIRVAVRALTRKPVDDPLLGLSGDIDGLPADLSANFHRHLDQTFVAETPAPYRARRRSGKAVRR